MMKKQTNIQSVFSIIFLVMLLHFFSLKGICQTYNCNMVSTSNFDSDMKESKNVINIEADKAQITISKFIGGVDPLIISIDSVRNKDYNFDKCKWYYGHSNDRKNIVIVPNNKNVVNLFDFADEVTVFHYQFHYPYFKKK